MKTADMPPHSKAEAIAAWNTRANNDAADYLVHTAELLIDAVGHPERDNSDDGLCERATAFRIALSAWLLKS